MKFLSFLLIVGGFIQLIQVVLEVNYSPPNIKDLEVGIISVAQVLTGMFLADYEKHLSKLKEM